MNRGIVALAITVIGCTPTVQEGRLFRHDVAAVSRFRIANASAQSTDVTADLVDGTSCKGRVSRTDNADHSVSPEAESMGCTDGGVGVLVCASNAVLRCRLVHRQAESYAYGECIDQSGVKYMVVF